MKSVQISFTTNPKLRDDCNHLAHDLGVSLSTVLNMCLVQFRYRRGIPFPTTVPKPSHAELNYRMDEITKHHQFKKHRINVKK